MPERSFLTYDEACDEFRRLIDLQRGLSLWFMGSPAELDILHPQASRILDQIAVHCSRDIWVRVRRLKTWLSQNSR